MFKTHNNRKNCISNTRITLIRENRVTDFCAAGNVFVLPFLYNLAFLHSPHQPVYTATKHGVIGFTRAMAVRYIHTRTLQVQPSKMSPPCQMPIDWQPTIYASTSRHNEFLVAKFLLNRMSHSMFLQDASSQGGYGVRINVLCPAFVDTPLLHSVEHEDNMGKFVKFKDDFKRSMNKFGVLQ